MMTLGFRIVNAWTLDVTTSADTRQNTAFTLLYVLLSMRIFDMESYF